jgi:hypothetical protein
MRVKTVTEKILSAMPRSGFMAAPGGDAPAHWRQAER